MKIKYKEIDFSCCHQNVDLYSYAYDSPIERILGELMCKFMNRSSVTIFPQVEIQTLGGLFVLDFLIVSGGQKYAVECDGRDYHEYYGDLYRDTMLLANKFIDGMLRFRGVDINQVPHACLLILSKILPSFLMEGREETLEQEVRNERWDLTRNRDTEGKTFYDEILFSDPVDFDDEGVFPISCGKTMEITHRCNRHSPDSPKPEWLKALEFINEHIIRSKEEFVSKYPNRFSNRDDAF